MEFDEIVVKESPGLCRCCLSEGCYKDLGTDYVWMDDTEIYADMLLECFDISISQHIEGPNGPNRFICEVCITRLRDACNFKKQVLESEKKFIDMLGRGEFKSKVIAYQDQMKSEEIQSVMDTEVEFLEDDIDFDDGPSNDITEQSISEDITIETLPIKSRKGRPRKNAVKPEKKKTKIEDKPKAKLVRGGNHKESVKITRKRLNTKKTQITKQDSTFDFFKRNTTHVLENSTVMPFIWLRTCFRCFYCYEIFDEHSTLKSHQKSHTLTDIYDTMNKFHENLVIIDVSEISCKICHMVMSDIFQLVHHLVVIHRIDYNTNIGVNMAPVNLNEGIKCVFCSMMFKTISHLILHMNRYHKNCLKSMCNSCGVQFKSYDDFCEHVKKDLADDNLKCSQCDLYLNYGVLRTHMRDVHGMRYKCLSCFEFFPSHYKRSNHMADIHNRRDRIKCSYCSRSFIFQSILMRHIRENHLKQKNIVCEVCGWRTYGKHELDNHMAKHDTVRHVRCPLCDKSFKTNKYMKKHYLKAHK